MLKQLVTEQGNEKCIEIAVIMHYLQPKTIQSNESISNKNQVRPNAFGKMNPCLNIQKSSLLGTEKELHQTQSQSPVSFPTPQDTNPSKVKREIGKTQQRTRTSTHTYNRKKKWTICV